jgi:glycosyltransferase involved in cell wall biosynthesis
MKLCIVTHNVIPNDGQGRLNYEIIREASQHGHQVTVVSSQLAPELQHNSQVNWISIPVKELPTQLVREVVFSSRSADWLRQHRQEFDLVIANGAVTSAAADVNMVSFVHRAWLSSPFHVSRVRRDAYGLYQWLYTFLNAHWERTAFRQAKVVVGVSQRVKRELVETGIPPARIRVIPCGVNLEEFSPGSANRRRWGLPEDVPLALFAGDIRLNRKNLDTVLHALVDVPDLHLAVAGQTEGSLYPDIAAQLGLSQRVHFLGLQPSISELLRAVVLEAMATGLPVITATTTGAAEVVTPDSGIVLSDSEDAQALAQALLHLTRDPVLRYHMGHTARTVAQQHSWTAMANSYLNLFEEIASRKAQLSPSWLGSNIPALEL